MAAPKIHIEKEKDNIIEFTLTNSSTAFANSLRRTIMYEVPVLSVVEAEFFENNSSIFDEFIAHRLGMIPLKTPLKELKPPGQCENGKCSLCSVTYQLEVEGPCTVYSKDMKPDNENAMPAFDNIPIMRLDEGQRLKLAAHASLGEGREHARWQTGLASYKTSKTKPDFQFTLESYGNLAPVEILNKALEIISEKAKNLKKQLKKET
ncbi:DNA-directed RNA polymerase subunit D [archaeon]|nr:DNA-directed RNA polymerase subunit D [archaeon]